MKHRYTHGLIILIIIISSFDLGAQWAHKSSLPGPARWKAASFVIGNKIYVVGGMDALGNILSDVWQYDMLTNTWMPMSDFPGPARCAAVAFAVNNKGYLSTGDVGNNHFLKDMWEYDPVADLWTQKASLFSASYQRREAIVFTIGVKAYIGFGEGWHFGDTNTLTTLYDLMEYNTQTDAWNFLPSLSYTNNPGKMAVAATVNNKGYVGLGGNLNQSIGYQNFWEFDPDSSSWTKKADFPSVSTLDAAAFSHNSRIYVVGGISPSDNFLSRQFYEYDPGSDSWKKLMDFDGGFIAGEYAVSDGTRAFVGTGFTGAITTCSDLWELTNVISAPTTGLDSHKLQVIHAGVFPNPATDIISITSSFKVQDVEIYDAKGSLVLSEKNNFDGISVLNLENGIYCVKLNYENAESSTLKFIKNP